MGAESCHPRGAAGAGSGAGSSHTQRELAGAEQGHCQVQLDILRQPNPSQLQPLQKKLHQFMAKVLRLGGYAAGEGSAAGCPSGWIRRKTLHGYCDCYSPKHGVRYTTSAGAMSKTHSSPMGVHRSGP